MMAQQNSSSKWYSHSIFGQFWNHYNHCNKWLTENGHKVIQFSDDLGNNSNDLNANQSISNNNNNTMFYGNNSCGDIDKASINSRCVNESKMNQLEVIDQNDEDFGDCNDSDESEQFDISEDYLQFVIKTKRHQLERKRLRERKQRYDNRVEYVDISKFDSFSNKSLAPKKNVKQQDISANKNQKMYELYGEDYNVIQGMEAALQLNFDRLCDSYQPKFWPIMPIRM